MVFLSGYTRLFYPTFLQTCLSSSLKYFLPLPLTHIHSTSVSSITLPAQLKLSGSPPAQSLENADLQYSTFCHGMQHREMLFYTRVGERQQQCNLVYYWAAYEESTTPTFQPSSTRTASISRGERVWGKRKKKRVSVLFPALNSWRICKIDVNAWSWSQAPAHE